MSSEKERRALNVKYPGLCLVLLAVAWLVGFLACYALVKAWLSLFV